MDRYHHCPCPPKERHPGDMEGAIPWNEPAKDGMKTVRA